MGSFQTSPGVYPSEVDLTAGIPAISVSTGALVGTFNWGPIFQITQTVSETDLVSKFGQPDSNTANTVFTGINFLSYSADLQVVRALGSGAKNATSNGVGSLIMNTDDYFNNNYPTIVTNAFVARYAGALGNSIKAYVFANTAGWTAIAANTSDPLHDFANQFSFAPNTSPYVSRVTNGAISGDEIHVLVVDSLGQITGQANTVLERFQSLSRFKDSSGPDGSSNYYKEFVYRNSKWLYVTGVPNSNTVGWDITVAGATGVVQNVESSNTSTMAGGADGTVTAANVVTGMGLFSDPTTADISLFLVGAGGQVETNQATAIAIQRGDCVVFASPPLANTLNPAGPATAIVNYIGGLTRSSYTFMDSGWKYQYDKYNDQYRWVPLNGDIAGLCARTDNVKDPWWSPAGLQRGQILNSVKLAYNPKLADRDTLYKAGVNPVVTFPGEGTMLFGDKTFLNFASAFDRINVRRLFIVLEKSISRAARASLFEFNDPFTQAQFVNLVTPFLRTVQGRRGIYNFSVVCNDTNNTPDVVDANQFVGDIFIQPAKSINYIQLHFIAVRTGVSFSEIVGSF